MVGEYLMVLFADADPVLLVRIGGLMGMKDEILSLQR